MGDFLYSFFGFHLFWNAKEEKMTSKENKKKNERGERIIIYCGVSRGLRAMRYHIVAERREKIE